MREGGKALAGETLSLPSEQQPFLQGLNAPQTS